MPRKVDGCHIHIPKHGALSAVDTRVTNFPAGGGCSYSFVNWEMLSVRPNRGMLTPSH